MGLTEKPAALRRAQTAKKGFVGATLVARLPPMAAGHPHQSKIGSEEPIFDSFSLKGEALGGDLNRVA